MLKIIQRFGKHRSCHLQGEYAMVRRFWKPYLGQAVGEELDLMVPIDGAEQRAHPRKPKLYNKHPSSPFC
jgi:hypothetical protein